MGCSRCSSTKVDTRWICHVVRAPNARLLGDLAAVRSTCTCKSEDACAIDAFAAARSVSTSLDAVSRSLMRLKVRSLTPRKDTSAWSSEIGATYIAFASSGNIFRLGATKQKYQLIRENSR